MVNRYSKSKEILQTFILLFFLLWLIACASDVDYTPPEDSQEMAITHYSFGKIIIDGKTFGYDIAILPDNSIKKWRVKISHAIQLVDIRELISEPTETLIIGIGANKECSITDDIVELSKSKGVRLEVLDTYEAVRLFNKLPKAGLSACFHLNC
jgi:hypothetical protein